MFLVAGGLVWLASASLAAMRDEPGKDDTRHHHDESRTRERSAGQPRQTRKPKFESTTTPIGRGTAGAGPHNLRLHTKSRLTVLVESQHSGQSRCRYLGRSAATSPPDECTRLRRVRATSPQVNVSLIWGGLGGGSMA